MERVTDETDFNFPHFPIRLAKFINGEPWQRRERWVTRGEGVSDDPWPHTWWIGYKATVPASSLTGVEGGFIEFGTFKCSRWQAILIYFGLARVPVAK